MNLDGEFTPITIPADDDNEDDALPVAAQARGGRMPRVLCRDRSE